MADPESKLTLTREIARSGIATVWEGYDSGLDRKVLVKSIHPQYAREEDLRARFEREARAIARLSHPNVVQIYNLHSTADDLSLVLEFVEGENLGKLLKDRGALPTEVAITIAEEILAGLEQAHIAGIVHRDLKPDNILVSHKGEVKITDFGLASLRDMPSVTQEGMVMGTPSYMAPEQAEGVSVTAATDVFAVGLILFEMLTGQRVMQGATLAETFQNVLKYQPPAFENFKELIPENVELVLRKMLERMPARRFSSAEEARSALIQDPQNILPKPLIEDFLSGGTTVRRATTASVARAKEWTKPLRIFSFVVLMLVGIALVYHFASLNRPQQAPRDPLVYAPADTTAIQTPEKINPDSGKITLIEEKKQPPESKPDTKPIISNVNPKIIVPPPVVEKDTVGFLEISCRPWAQIFFHDAMIGTTPLSSPLKLPVGTHSLVLLNPEIGLPITQSVMVEGGKTTDLKINLYDRVARIKIASVKPWADVYINGKLEVRTPSSKIIFRPLGTYTISLKNPDFPEYTETLTFKEGDPIREIRKDFTQK